MLASELIVRLAGLVDQYGDHPISVPDEGCSCCYSGGDRDPDVAFFPEKITAYRNTGSVITGNTVYEVDLGNEISYATPAHYYIGAA